MQIACKHEGIAKIGNLNGGPAKMKSKRAWAGGVSLSLLENEFLFYTLIDFSVKLSTIRIWMHEKDIGKLTRILWAGQGPRLCQQASNNGRVKRFLAAVPHVMVSAGGGAAAGECHNPLPLRMPARICIRQ